MDAKTNLKLPPPSRDNAEATKNAKGSTFHNIGEPEKQWVTSLPKSHLPLLDLGACYGVQTMYAMKEGRNVIALDCCEEHIIILRERVSEMHRTDTTGELVDTIVAELPASDVIDDESVSGILCSEVIHFMTPADLRPFFKDVYRWLAPGGKLVVMTGSWPPRLAALVARGLTQADGLTVDESYDMLMKRPASEVVDAAPGMMMLPRKASVQAACGDHFYMLSTEELRYVSESSGFVVDRLEYYAGGKYGNENSETQQETVLLVASKPDATR